MNLGKSRLSEVRLVRHRHFQLRKHRGQEKEHLEHFPPKRAKTGQDNGVSALSFPTSACPFIRCERSSLSMVLVSKEYILYGFFCEVLVPKQKQEYEKIILPLVEVASGSLYNL